MVIYFYLFLLSTCIILLFYPTVNARNFEYQFCVEFLHSNRRTFTVLFIVDRTVDYFIGTVYVRRKINTCCFFFLAVHSLAVFIYENHVPSPKSTIYQWYLFNKLLITPCINQRMITVENTKKSTTGLPLLVANNNIKKQE